MRCSRYAKAHNVAHFQEHQHCLALSLSDLTVWCYECDKYVKSSALHELLEGAERAKFRDDAHEDAPERPPRPPRVGDSRVGVCYDPRGEKHVFSAGACRLSGDMQVHAGLAALEGPDRVKTALVALTEQNLLSRWVSVW